MEYHLKFINEESRHVRQTIPCQLGIDYGCSEKEKIDIFGTDLPDDAPTVVFVHGGYWQTMSRSSTSYVAKAFYKEGIKVMVVGYNLCPSVSMEKIVEEIANATKFCLEYARKLGCRSVALGGHSAGAHLIATLFMNCFEDLQVDDQTIVKSIFLMSGVYNLLPLMHVSMSKPLKLNEALAHKLSPQMHSIKSNNKSLIFQIYVGKEEVTALKKQSEDYHKKLIESGYISDLCTLQDTDHLNIARKLVENDYVVVLKVKELLK